MRDAIAWTLAVVAMAIAVPAQCLMFLAEWVGDKSDEWVS